MTLRVIADCTLNQGAYAEYIAVNQTHIITKPPYLTWVEAASIPEAFLTGEWDQIVRQLFSDTRRSAFQALVVIGQVKKDDNVLVHAGASGVGLAAIQLARVYGA